MPLNPPRPSRARRGMTLVELLIALVMLGVVSTALYRVLLNNQRIYQTQTQHIDLQQNMRAAVTLLPAELREIDATDGDIEAMSPTAITIRAMRWMGFICAPPVLGGAVVGTGMTVRAQPFYGTRRLNTGTDSMFIYYDGDQTTRDDDDWALARPTDVANGLCPDGQAGLVITMSWKLAPPNTPGGILPGSPVRGFETVTYQLYKPPSDSLWYVGMQPAGGTIAPVIGPVIEGGLSFAYFDSTGAVTTVPTRVARIDVVVRERTIQAVQNAAGAGKAVAVDSVLTSVALRNNRRY
ncbi:MAG TPA: prepilin-type N-terminal cleavage/methylation domain-containing protein [Gemmatimonadales bacterium]|nr:prepilin-type N-terminal cleavage/methylation domain-containing protein [Gemmatimonadales bacterium]